MCSQCDAEDVREAEVCFVINHLDKFLNTGQRLLTKILNDTKHFSQLIERIDDLLGTQVTKVRFSIVNGQLSLSKL